MDGMVSVIVPTYNREQYIGRAIYSILRQTYDKYEILIIDDGSTDNTQDVVRKLCEKENAGDRIRYIKLEQNQGVAHARNVGIQEAKYDYIAFLDSDDEWLPEKLQLQMEKMMEEAEETGLVYCRMSGIERGGKNRYVCPSQSIGKEILEGNIFTRLLRQNVIGTPCVLVRRECLEQVGGFKESLKALEDWELFLRIAKNWRIGFVDEILLEVYSLPNSISTDVGGFLVARCYMVSKYRRQMTEEGILDAITEDILKIARQCHAAEEIQELLNMDFEL